MGPQRKERDERSYSKDVAAADAIVVGAGPNGLAAAIVLARAGLHGRRLRGAGGHRRRLPIRTADAAGFRARRVLGRAPHGGRVAVLPLAAARDHGLAWIEPPVDAGPSIRSTKCPPRSSSARSRKPRRSRCAMRMPTAVWSGAWSISGRSSNDSFSAASLPRHPISRRTVRSSARCRRAIGSPQRSFSTESARALLAGIAAHGMLPLDKLPSGAIGLVLAALAHIVGWPIPRGGAQRLADALASYLRSLGGEIVTRHACRLISRICRRRKRSCAICRRARSLRDCRPSTPGLVQAQTRAVSLRHGRIQSGLGARCADSLARCRGCASGNRSPRRLAANEIASSERDAWEGADLRAGRSCSWRSPACSTRHARRQASTPCGPIVMCRMRRRATCCRYRAANRALRARFSRPHARPARDDAGRSRGRNPNLVGGDIGMGGHAISVS